MNLFSTIPALPILTGFPEKLFDPEKLFVLEGTGQWIRRSWVLQRVNLFGVDTAPLTGGPLFVSDGEPVYISRVDLALIRTGDHPLAWQDPLANCYSDSRICEYGNYAEMDLHNDIRDGIDLGRSGGRSGRSGSPPP